MTSLISSAMVLAAGHGRRLRPITDRLPKPLVRVGGVAMLDRILDSLEAARIGTVVINVHHLADQIVDHVAARRPRPLISREDSPLETGGGIKKALGHFADAPFFVLNGDIFWRDGPVPALSRLAATWDGSEMDALLLLQSTVRAIGYEGQGDFLLGQDGRLTRRPENRIAPFLFAGIQILHPRLFADTPERAFSLNLLYDRAAASGRLFGICHDGDWCHVGRPDHLAATEEWLALYGRDFF